MQSDARILAVLPTSRGGFGFAVLEGQTRLLEWGTVSKNTPKYFRRRIQKLVDRYSPLLVTAEAKPRARAQHRFLKMIGTLSVEQELSFRILPKDYGTIANPNIRTRFQCAQAVTEQFPELQPCFPRKRKPWESEPEAVTMLSAVTLALSVVELWT